MVITLTKMIIINDDNVMVITLTKIMVVVVTIRVDGDRTCTTFATNATDIFSIRGGV